jgi:putative ABC transport system permease protein
MTQFRLILCALKRHRLAAGLIVLQIALTCAVLGNAMFLIGARLDLIGIDSGIDETRVGFVRLSNCDGCSHADVNGRALAALRAVPGVRAAGTINSVPFAQPALNAGFFRDQHGKEFVGVTHFYLVGPGATDALGLHPQLGREFSVADYQPVTGFGPGNAEVWVSQALARHMWPDQPALGGELWAGHSHLRVAGVLAHFPLPMPGRSEGGVQAAGWSVIVPVREDAQSGSYVYSTAPGQLAQVSAAVREAVVNAVPEAVLDMHDSRGMDELRQRYFQHDRTMAWLLLTVIVAMLLVTALGIVGLASFWVAQRTRQIGVRRALGATRGDILRYFQAENLVLVVTGTVLGMLLAYAGNALLMRLFELQRLPAMYLPVAALLLLALGQLAVLGPARRAAAVPPATATRSI